MSNKFKVGSSIKADFPCPNCQARMVLRWVLMGSAKIGYWLDFRKVEYIKKVNDEHIK